MKRSLHCIASEIRHDWLRPNFAAKPYLEAMARLGTIDSYYGHDSAKSIVRYFLSNAATWRGETARRVKAELKDLLK